MINDTLHFIQCTVCHMGTVRNTDEWIMVNLQIYLALQFNNIVVMWTLLRYVLLWLLHQLPF